MQALAKIMKTERYQLGLRIDKEISLIDKVERYQANIVGALSSIFLAIMVTIGNVLAHLGLIELQQQHPDVYKHPLDFMKGLVPNITGFAANMTAMQNDAEDVMESRLGLIAEAFFLLIGLAVVAWRYGACSRRAETKPDGYSRVGPGSQEMTNLLDNREASTP